MGCFFYLLLCNKSPQTWDLKQYLIACKSAVWAGLSQDGSSLIHVASAGAAGLKAGEFQDDSYTWLISWCWMLAGNSANAAFLSLGSLDFLLEEAGFQENKIVVHGIFMTTPQKSHSVTFTIFY